jgi:hypothetical protein
MKTSIVYPAPKNTVSLHSIAQATYFQGIENIFITFLHPLEMKREGDSLPSVNEGADLGRRGFLQVHPAEARCSTLVLDGPTPKRFVTGRPSWPVTFQRD